jgi:hypothetical protein
VGRDLRQAAGIAERFKLRFGPHEAPRFRAGQVVRCESEGRIPWPVGIKGSNRALVVCTGLAKAVRRKSTQAVAGGVNAYLLRTLDHVAEPLRSERTG